jgi:hypothetical protein
MTTEPVELAALIEARDRMIKELQAGLDADQRRFLLSFVGFERNSRSINARAFLPTVCFGALRLRYARIEPLR